jgi:hypothetical protein
MEHRRQISRIFPGLVVAVLVASLAVLNGCGGGAGWGGGMSTNAVNVSLASATSFPAGTTYASSTLSPPTAAPPANSPVFDNVFVTVTKIALIPSTGTEFPDANGQLETPDSPAEEGRGFVTATLGSPVKIDLLHLTGDNAAMLLNKFSAVPAGEYSKIRVYYDNVVGRSGSVDTLFHPTAHYHFDVHFVGGNLVIPVTTDPQGGIRFFSVVINVVGLKYNQAGQSGNVLLRPQVFTTVDNSSLKFIVHGVAEHVNRSAGTFNVITAGNDNISAEYRSATSWFYVDGRFVGPFTSFKISGDNALRDTALVDVIGTFQSGVLIAGEVDITFPGEKSGAVDSGWRADNTFILRLAADNVVFPMPNRFLAYYDNAIAPFAPLNDAAIDNNVQVKARGYNVPGGIEAYWITVGP